MVTFIQKDVEKAVSDIKAALPSFSREKRLLSLCFIDPFSAELDFNVIRELGAAFRMDFLILLYHLLFYSKHPLAKELFRAARAATDPQTSLGF